MSPTRWRWPPLSSAGIAAQHRLVEADQLGQRRARARRSAPRGQPTRLGRQAHVAADGEVRVEPALLDDVADAPDQVAARGGRDGARRRRAPRRRRASTSPRITRSRVDLPEPLEPSSTWVVPGATSSETSSSATVAPYRLLTWRTAIIRPGVYADSAGGERALHGRYSRVKWSSITSPSVLTVKLEVISPRAPAKAPSPPVIVHTTPPTTQPGSRRRRHPSAPDRLERHGAGGAIGDRAVLDEAAVAEPLDSRLQHRALPRHRLDSRPQSPRAPAPSTASDSAPCSAPAA